MINNKKVLGFIPARGGSKGIPNKNLKKIDGKELIGYTILASLNTGICDKIIVDTDSEDIAIISKKYGAEIPYKRPQQLAQDDSNMMDVIMNTMEWFENKNEKYDIFLYLQPTSPLRSSTDILDAFNLFFTKNADSIISVNKSKSFPERMNKLQTDLRMKNFCITNAGKQNRQQLGTYFELNGAVHIAKWEILKSAKTWYVENSFAFIMDLPNCLDIDEEIDLHFAEFLVKNGYARV